MEKHLIILKVNGESYTIEIESRETLLRLLRERLDLTGTKEGCSHGECGVCIVLVNGKTMNSCLIPAVAVQDQDILTIEGLSKGETLHPLQKSLSLMEILGGTTIEMITSAKIRAITQDGIEYLDHEVKSHTILADTVILATGFVPRLEFVQLFKESSPNIYMVVNCKNPGKIIDAIDHAAMVALRI